MRPGTTSRPAASATRLASAGSMFGATRAIFPLAIATSMTATPIAQHQILVSTVACSFRRGEHLAQPPRDDLVLARPHHPDADDHAAAPLGANRDRGLAVPERRHDLGRRDAAGSRIPRD